MHHVRQQAIKTQNALHFFAYVVHYDDTAVAKEECLSLKRRKARRLNQSESKQDGPLNNKQAAALIAKEARKTMELSIRNTWALRQHYMQSEMDRIHAHLVHTSWIHYHSLQQLEESVIESENHVFGSNYVSLDDKFKSDNPEFRFGEKHDYIQLSPRHESIYAELRLDESGIDNVTWQIELTKAINKHSEAINKHGTKYICKYYDPKYGYHRNQKILLRHVLAVVLYTDLSKFQRDIPSH